MAISRAWLDRVGGFDGNLGARGDTFLGGEGFDLQDRIIAAGGKVIYVPSLVQYNFLRPECRRKHYWRRHAFGLGRTEFRVERATWAKANVFLGAPRTMWAYLVTGSLRRYLQSLLTFDNTVIFQRELGIWHRLGNIFEARLQHRADVQQ